ncbi:hypothetical protein V6N12_009318 [Hibiscus sabdariffa]|uniref:RNase H type-1 domain-containing protein n=1 Tax=Hibiscus sabdariffa TaxID=183260 RepID=A0ABR2ECE1_9ROSI
MVRTVNGFVVIKEWLQRPWNAKVIHISRQSNNVVDWFAKVLRDHTVNTVFFEESSDGIPSLLEYDLRCRNDT